MKMAVTKPRAFPGIEQWKASPSSVAKLLVTPDRPCHLRTARLLGTIAGQSSPEEAAGILSRIYEQDPQRAGLLAVDIACQSSSGTAAGIIEATGKKDDFIGIISSLPTIDAAKFLHSWLRPGNSVDSALSYAKHFAAWQTLSPGITSSIPYIEHHYGNWILPHLGALEGRSSPERRNFGPLVESSSHPAVKAFYDWASRCFPDHKYGYHSAAEGLSNPKKYNISVPDDEDIDGFSGSSHQCMNTAIAARGFMAQHGIPADVLYVKVPTGEHGEGIYHDITAAFIKDGAGYSPVMIDASPFRGLYSDRTLINLSEHDVYRKAHPSYVVRYAPMDWAALSAKLPLTYNILEEFSTRYTCSGNSDGDSVASGGMPWFYAKLGSGRVMFGFASICESPDTGKAGMLTMERGSEAYYGRGPMERVPSIALDILGHGGKAKHVTLPLPVHTAPAVALAEPQHILPEIKNSLKSPLAEEIAAILPQYVISFLDTVSRFGLRTGRIRK